MARLRDKIGGRNPWAAAVLNFFFWGLGYLYAGRKLLLGACLSSFVFIVILAGGIAAQDPAQALGLMLLAWLLLSTAFARDAYLDAKLRKSVPDRKVKNPSLTEEVPPRLKRRGLLADDEVSDHE